MKTGRSDLSGAGRTSPIWIKVLVGLHVFAITVWALPYPPKAVLEEREKPWATVWLLYWNAKYLKTLNPVRAYLFATGTWQYWDMFAPEPSSIDWYGTADVTYRDGTTKTVDYPRMAKLPIATKYVKERYRKFYERAHNEEEPRIWPAFAQTMALRAYEDPKNPPVVVRLRRHWLAIADPGKPQAKEYSSFVYYTYAVDGRWLRQASGGK